MLASNADVGRFVDLMCPSIYILFPYGNGKLAEPTRRRQLSRIVVNVYRTRRIIEAQKKREKRERWGIGQRQRLSNCFCSVWIISGGPPRSFRTGPSHSMLRLWKWGGAQYALARSINSQLSIPIWIHGRKTRDRFSLAGPCCMIETMKIANKTLEPTRLSQHYLFKNPVSVA